MYIILKKWIEPYILLENLKRNYKLYKMFKFDGFSKDTEKQSFLKSLKQSNIFGLYLKNVNIFYLFKGKLDLKQVIQLNEQDYEIINDIETIFETVDLGKAEAGFFNCICIH